MLNKEELLTRCDRIDELLDIQLEQLGIMNKINNNKWEFFLDIFKGNFKKAVEKFNLCEDEINRLEMEIYFS